MSGNTEKGLCSVKYGMITFFFLFLNRECAKLVLSFEFQQSDDDAKDAFKEITLVASNNLQQFMISQIFLVLQWLIVNGWNHPTLSAMMTGGEVEEENGKTFEALIFFSHIECIYVLIYS